MRDQLFTFIFLGLLLLAATELTAQVTDRQQQMSRGNNASLVLELPSAEDKLVEDLWTDWLKDNYKVKTSKTRKTRTGELSSLNFRLPGISAGGNIDLYSVVEEVGDGSELSIWIATPRGYVSPELDSGQYIEAEKMLMRFALAVSRAQIEDDVDSEEDHLKELERDLKRLQRDKEKAENEIADARRRIEELEAEIVSNEAEQELKQDEIVSQTRVVEDTKRKLKDY
jgi:hypothetical protein